MGPMPLKELFHKKINVITQKNIYEKVSFQQNAALECIYTYIHTYNLDFKN